MRGLHFPTESAVNAKLPGSLGDSASRIRFSDVPIAIAILLKPAVDALYAISSVKFVYMAYIFFAAFLSLAGKYLSSGKAGLEAAEQRAYAKHAIVFGIYLVFLLVILVVYSGQFTQVFKILSPFVLFLLIAPTVGPWSIKIIGVMSLLTILVNAGLLPFDRSWVYWGGTRTFKGFYFFKTDLAYAMTLATLGLAFWQRFRLNPLLIVGIGLASVQVVLANSRINYLLFAVVVIFIFLKGGVRFWVLIRSGAVVSAILSVSMYLYDSNQLLGFDISDPGKFTQGRNQIWDILVNEGLAQYTLSELIFGRGLEADAQLFAAHVYTGDALNAHNELLHLVITQGILGTALYLLLWISVFKVYTWRSLPGWASGVGLISITLLALQSLTAVVSSYASKTWPVMFVILAIVSLRSGTHAGVTAEPPRP
jgi:hypothetical protein